MKETNETNTTESSEELSSLRDSLRQALDDGDMKRAGEIKAEILPHLEAVKEKLTVSTEKAKEIMGGDFFGKEAIEKTFDNIKLEKADIPSIPFTEKELERAKVFGGLLILRLGQLPTGEELTMRNMDRILDKKWEDANLGRVSYIGNRVSDTEANYFQREAPRPGWAIVGKNSLIDTRGVNYVQQTSRLLAFLKNEFYRDMPLPEDLAKADEEYTSKIWQITRGDLLDTQRAVDLAVNQNYRQTPVEFLYDEVVFMSSLLPNMAYVGKNVLTNRYEVTDSGSLGIVAVSSPGGLGLKIDSRNVGFYVKRGVGASFAIIK